MSRNILTRVSSLFLISLLVLTGFSAFDDALSTAEAAGARARKKTRSARRRASRRALQRRTISKRRVPSRTNRALPPVPGSYPIAPDQIEVIEHGPAVQSLAHPAPLRRPAVSTNSVPNSNDASQPTVSNISRRRISTRIDGDRVIEIQQALRDRGMFDGEPTGVYDDSTVESMRRFQLKERINATGYPTAHALKRLGLAR